MVITDKTEIGLVCGESCIPGNGYHLNDIGVGLPDLYEPYRSLLLGAEANKKKLKEALAICKIYYNRSEKDLDACVKADLRYEKLKQ